MKNDLRTDLIIGIALTLISILIGVGVVWCRGWVW